MSDPATSTAPSHKFPVLTFFDASKAEADVSWNAFDLTAAMMNQASLFVYYGNQSAKGSAQVDSFKLKIEVVEASIYRALRDEAIKAGLKVTENQLAADVAAHATVQALKIALNEAKQVENTLKTLVEGFRHRKDMLVSQGLLNREEMRGETGIRAQHDALAAQQEKVRDAIRAATA